MMRTHHGEGDHRVGLRQPQHDAAEGVHDDADTDGGAERELERVGDPAAHLGVVRRVGRRPFGPGLGGPLRTGCEQQHHTDDEHRLVGDEPEREHDGAEGERHRPDAVGRRPGGCGRRLDGLDLVGPDVGVAGVDVDAGQEGERDRRRREADRAHDTVLGDAVRDRRDRCQDGGADEEF
jgi:hypothetical protein